MKIIIDSDIPYIRGVLEPYAEVEYTPGNAITSEPRAADMLIIRTRTRCSRDFLSRSRVGMIATATIGHDHIDMEYCFRAGIPVATAAGCNARGVLQWVAAALVWLSRSQDWEPSARTLGVVGVGNVGSLVAAYARNWGFNVLCCDPPRQRAGQEGFVDLDEISRRCDIVTFHVPLTKEGPDSTRHLAGSQFFENSRAGAVILNSSRGEVVDGSSLLHAVAQGRNSFIADTWEREPAVDPEMLTEALLATPHIAGYTAQGKANATAAVVRAAACRFGLPLSDWYPSGDVRPTIPRAITWSELYETVDGYFDIEGESRILKSAPEAFEKIRNSYNYRQEYF